MRNYDVDYLQIGSIQLERREPKRTGNSKPKRKPLALPPTLVVDAHKINLALPFKLGKKQKRKKRKKRRMKRRRKRNYRRPMRFQLNLQPIVQVIPYLLDRSLIATALPYLTT